MLMRAAALVGFLAMLVLLDGCQAIPVASAQEIRRERTPPEQRSCGEEARVETSSIGVARWTECKESV